ncbi:MAG: imidazole glycerol phosphate synthase subunit HisH [Planctomycetes bacterium]|nr:imidazole glycerol phosphate synthase subunit HisH [Planctomycetota bacterium]
MIAIVDYGLGNLKSVKSACDRLGVDGTVTSDAAAILGADGVIFPGVGAFQRAMENLGKLGLVEPLRQVAHSGRPFLGICLGLQLLFAESSEHGHHEGLNIIPGKVVRFEPGAGRRLPEGRTPNSSASAFGVLPSGSLGGPPGADEPLKALKVPHMGWNQVRQERPSPLFEGVPDRSFFYFAHSYYAEPDDAAVAIGSTEYGVRFASAVQKGNVFATQFHPEKSGPVGLRMLENFCGLCRRR